MAGDPVDRPEPEIGEYGLVRLRQGKALSADGLAALVAWLYPSSCPSWIVLGELAESPEPGEVGT